MTLFLNFVFIFFIGSTFGWILEIFFRRIAHGKWVNPGFLVGPYLPIYGFGLCALSLSYIAFNSLKLSPIIIILLMGLFMTLIELIGGLCFLKGGGVKLWDYSNLKFNYKGIICPQFSLIWTVFGGLYYFFIAPHILNLLEWFKYNEPFSFILGVFFGIIIIDFVYSTNILVKLRKYAKDNGIIIKYEELRKQIKDKEDLLKNKYHFVFSFKQTNPLKEYLENYKNNLIKQKNK